MKRTLHFPEWSLWGWCFVLLLMGGIHASWVRFVHGSGDFGSLGKVFPCSLIIGLNVLCGIAIATGGLTVAATIYVLNLERHRSIVRASLVTGFLGYVVAVLGLVSSPGRIAFQAGPWGTRSSFYGIIWVSALFIAVLVLEFAPEMWEHFGGHEPPHWLQSLNVPVLFAALVFLVLYQTGLADLLRSLPEEVSPLWSSPQLPFFFFISGACAGLAVVIFASWHMNVATRKGLLPERVAGLGSVLAALLFLYLGIRIADLVYRGIPLLVWENNTENVLLELEMALIVVPMVLLVNPKNLQNPRMVYLCSAMVLAALITNRLNTCITAVETAMNLKYLPDWNEFLVAYSIVGLGVAAFGPIAKRLPVFLETWEE
jgi:Ni/Fe-hydrogenase subunit HybB-like protein